MAAAVGRKAPPARGLAPDDELLPEYWPALLGDAAADGSNPVSAASGRLLRLNEIPQHLLRVDCPRGRRTVEIHKIDAARLYGLDAIWGDVGQRLLDSTCSQRTGHHEEGRFGYSPHSPPRPG